MSDRYSRQADMIPAEKLVCAGSVMIVGVGAIGRQLALQLASIGVDRMVLIDHDVVDDSNVSTQGYLEKSIGRAKVHALRETLLEINKDMSVVVQNRKFDPLKDLSLLGVVFCCVDDLDVRKQIWDSVKNTLAFWCDARMLGEMMRILTYTRVFCDSPTTKTVESQADYEATLFKQAEAEVGRCTAKSTIYTAAIAAGLQVHQFSRWLRGIDCDKDFSVSLLGGMIIQAPLTGALGIEDVKSNSELQPGREGEESVCGELEPAIAG